MEQRGINYGNHISNETIRWQSGRSFNRQPAGEHHAHCRSELRGPFAGKDSIELGRAIDRLPELERLVLSLHYYGELNFTEIGMVLNLKQSKISRIHNHAMYRLKAGFTRS